MNNLGKTESSSSEAFAFVYNFAAMRECPYNDTIALLKKDRIVDLNMYCQFMSDLS
jgi:hypothetical protein